MSASARSFYPPNNGISRVKALYDYEGPDGSYEGKYLKFKTGDFIDVVEKCETGWWKGTLRNSEGLFPPTYCEELTPRRVLNVDTKKASPTIKRMQHLLKLTVTSTGEKVEEVQKEMPEEEKWFTRERAKLFLSSGKSKKGSEEKEGKEEGRISEPGVKDKPAQSAEVVNLQKRINELEADKVNMMAEFASKRAALLEEFASVQAKQQEEFSHKVSLLHEMLDEKTLVIEIMKKDLEIKEEENKQVTIELELEIEKLLQNCAELESQVGHLVPLPEENEDPLELTEARATNPMITIEETADISSSAETIEKISEETCEEISEETPKKVPQETPVEIPEETSEKIPQETPMEIPTAEENYPEVPVEKPSESGSSAGPSNDTPTAEATPAPVSIAALPAQLENYDFTTPAHDQSAPTAPSQDWPTPTTPLHESTTPVHDPATPTTSLHESTTPPTSLSNTLLVSAPRHQRFKTFHSLSNLTTLMTSSPTSTTSSPTSTTPSPTSTTASMNSRRTPMRPRRTPSMLYSPTLLPTPNSGRTKIPNLESSLAKLAELGPHPSARGREQPPDSQDPVAEISELKKRIAELETERLRMIEEYRSKLDKEKEKEKEKAQNSPALPSPSSHPLPSSSSPSIPPLALGSMKGRLPPPVPPPPSEAFDSLQEKKGDIFARLDEFEVLFRKNDTKTQYLDLQPVEKVVKILDAVRTTMPRYFYFVVLAIKYDAIQSGRKRFCNLDASELYDEAVARHLYHGDWPVFVRDKLAPTTGLTLSSSSLHIPSPTLLTLSSGSLSVPSAAPPGLSLSSTSFQVIPPPSPSSPSSPRTPTSLLTTFRSIFKK